MSKLIDVFKDDYLEKEATTFDEPVDKMPGLSREFVLSKGSNGMDYDMKKGNSFLNVTPGAVIGSAFGLVLGHKKGKKDMDRKMQEEMNRFNNAKPVIEGNYYQQAEHVMNNLGVVFTPFGTVYTLKHKNKNVAIDTIETNEMNKDMKSAWKQKNDEYFKGLMLSKMYSEMQIAEQGFAKQILEMQKNSDKTASETEYEVSEMSDFEVLMKCAELNEYIHIYSRGTEEHFDKLAEIEDNISNLEDVQFNLELDRPFDKYAGVLGGIKSSLGFGQSKETLKSMQTKFNNNHYLKNNLKVGFMPDRVLFTVDNTLVSTLPLMNMNRDGYDRFLKGDSKYFKNLFIQEIKKGMDTNNKFAMVESDHLEKSASEVELPSSTPEIFSISSTHPVIYFLVLTQKLKDKWFDYDPMALIKIIETEFKLTEPICDSALDKILSIKTANISNSVYEVPHAFEKVVRAFNNKPIDFLEKEDDDLDIDDFVFAIDVLNRVTPFDDIYDNFSPEVLDYIARVLAQRNTRCYAPSHVAFSPLEPTFQEIVNDVLLKATNRITTTDTQDVKVEEAIIKNNTYIHDMSLSVIRAVRRALENKEVQAINVVDEMIKRINVPESLTLIVKKEVIKNLALDEVLKAKEDTLYLQLAKCNITVPGGES